MAGTSTRRSTRSVSNPPEEIHEDDMYDEELENIKKHIDFHNESDEDSEDEYILSSSEEEYEGKNGEEEYDDYDENYNFKDALKGASNFRVRNRREKISKSSKNYYKRKMMRADNRELDPEVRSNLSQANEAFVRKDFGTAETLYLEVIKKMPKISQLSKPWVKFIKHKAISINVVIIGYWQQIFILGILNFGVKWQNYLLNWVILIKLFIVTVVQLRPMLEKVVILYYREHFYIKKENNLVKH